MNKILVVAAHADDEALGCAGTIAKHAEANDLVYVLFMTDGVSSRSNVNSIKAETRSNAAKEAMKVLGVTQSFQLNFPDNKMDTVSLLTIVKEIETVLSEISPNIIYTHFSGDLNIDHQITHRAVMTACRPQSWSSVKEIYCFEVLSSTEWGSITSPAFVPQKVVNITRQWVKKLAALKAYQEELRDFPHSRSYECIEALSILCGATHGHEKAEAFVIERIID